MLMVPFLFIAGVVFGYFLVLPPAISSCRTSTTTQFDILVQAQDYYKFAIMVAGRRWALLFQMPVGILALTRLGIVTPRQLRKSRRYAILVIARRGDAAARPGPGHDADR